MHAEHLGVHGVGPHTISIPRVKRADDIDPMPEFGNGIDDETLPRSAPACGLPSYTIISTRSKATREKVKSGRRIQISGASKTSASAGTVLRPRRGKLGPVRRQRQQDTGRGRLLADGVNAASFRASVRPVTGRAGRETDSCGVQQKRRELATGCHPNALMKT